MKLLLVEGSSPLAKEYIKANRKRQEITVINGGAAELHAPGRTEALVKDGGYRAVLWFMDGDGVRIFRNLQYACLKNDVRLILAGSVDGGGGLINAGDSEIPAGLGERGLVFALAAKDRVTTALRLFEVLPHIEFVTSGVQSAIFGRKAKKVKIGQNRRFSFIYSEDAVALITRFTDKALEKGCYNLVSGETVDSLAVAEQIVKIAARYDKDVTVAADEGEAPELTGSNENLRALFPKYEFVSLKNALNRYFKSKLPDKDE